MKKIITGCMLALCTVACSDRGGEVLLVEQTANKDIQQMQAQSRRGGLFTFVFDLGRGPKCQGWGICQLVAFGVEIVELPENPNHRSADVYKRTDGSFYALFELKQEMQLQDSTLYIDNDLTGEFDGSTYTIESGQYVLDSQIGEFGGYQIDITQQ